MAIPVVSPATEARGIFASDVVILQAIREAIADLRSQPWLIDYCFAAFSDDPVIARIYGAKTRDRAKAWFLSTDVPVVFSGHGPDAPPAAAVSVALSDSTEVEQVLGDVHTPTAEAADAIDPYLTAAFVPADWVPTTGRLTIPDDVTTIPALGMSVEDSDGHRFPVLDVETTKILVIEENSQVRSPVRLRTTSPRLSTQLEVRRFRETYRVGVHAHGDMEHLLWLHSIVLFCLLRYTEIGLEARGLERTTISSGPIQIDPDFGTGERVWVRFITMQGFVHHYWPKASTDRVLSVELGTGYAAAGTDPETFGQQPGFSDEDPSWLVADGLGLVVD